MTTQQSLSQIWAETGGVTEPTGTKYSTGWIAEIPTFQNFNYVLQTTTKNILSLAEKGAFDFDLEVNYVVGSVARGSDGKIYYALVGSLAQDPTTDTLHNYWKQSPTMGVDADISDGFKGLHLKELEGSAGTSVWDANDATLTAFKPLIGFNTTSATDNYLMGNISGHICVVNTGVESTPDGRDIAIGQTGVYKFYHEGNKPTQSDVPGTIDDAPANGEMFARRNNAWVEVTSTTVSSAPPPAVAGAGQGWYNLDDGVHYLDIDDGDSSQWVPANAPFAYRSGALDEAPEDGTPYAREDAGWVQTVREAPIDGQAYNRVNGAWQLDLGGATDPSLDYDWTGAHTFEGDVELLQDPAGTSSQKLSMTDSTGITIDMKNVGGAFSMEGEVVDGGAVVPYAFLDKGNYQFYNADGSPLFTAYDDFTIFGDTRSLLVNSGEVVLGQNGGDTGEAGITLNSSVSLKKAYVGTDGEALTIRSNSTSELTGEEMMRLIFDGGVQLLNDGILRLETNGTGVDITGALTVNGLPVGGGGGGGVELTDDPLWTGSHVQKMSQLMGVLGDTVQADLMFQDVTNAGNQYFIGIEYGTLTIQTHSLTPGGLAEYAMTFSQDGGVSLFYNGVNVLSTTSYGLYMLGDEIRFSAAASGIINKTGGGITLQHNSATKLETNATGVDITGALTVNGAPIAGGGGLPTPGVDGQYYVVKDDAYVDLSAQRLFFEDGLVVRYNYSSEVDPEDPQLGYFFVHPGDQVSYANYSPQTFWRAHDGSKTNYRYTAMQQRDKKFEIRQGNSSLSDHEVYSIDMFAGTHTWKDNSGDTIFSASSSGLTLAPGSYLSLSDQFHMSGQAGSSRFELTPSVGNNSPKMTFVGSSSFYETTFEQVDQDFEIRTNDKLFAVLNYELGVDLFYGGVSRHSTKPYGDAVGAGTGGNGGGDTIRRLYSETANVWYQMESLGAEFRLSYADPVDPLTAAGAPMMTAAPEGETRLHYDGDVKIATKVGGVDITGALTVNGSPLAGGGDLLADGTVPITGQINIDRQIVNDEIRLEGAAGSDGLIQKNATALRDELQIYAAGDAFSTGSVGAGIHLYGNSDDEHPGNLALLTGADGDGDAHLIVNQNGHVTVGSAIFDFTDNNEDRGHFNIKSSPTSSAVSVFIDNGSSAYGDFACDFLGELSFGTMNGLTYTESLRIEESLTIVPEGVRLELEGDTGSTGRLYKSAAAGRDLLLLSAGGDANSTGSDGAGLYLYGNSDASGAGRAVLMTGQDGAGTATLIATPDNDVNVGDDLFTFTGSEKGKLNVNSDGLPSLYFPDDSASANIAFEATDEFVISSMSGTVATERMAVSTAGVDITGALAVSGDVEAAGIKYAGGGASAMALACVASGGGEGTTVYENFGLTSITRNSAGNYTAVLSDTSWADTDLARRKVMPQVCNAIVALGVCNVTACFAAGTNTVSILFQDGSDAPVDPTNWNFKVEVLT